MVCLVNVFFTMVAVFFVSFVENFLLYFSHSFLPVSLCICVVCVEGGVR